VSESRRERVKQAVAAAYVAVVVLFMVSGGLPCGL